VTAVTQTAARGRARWTLPDDGIIDLIAIEIAAGGARPVTLTPAERRLAAARILARGGGASLIAKRLHLSGTTARRLAASIRAAAAPRTAADPRTTSPGWPVSACPASRHDPAGLSWLADAERAFVRAADSTAA
jgi:hypothetical protein